MPNDPLDLMDPSHPFHQMGMGFARNAQMEQQRRQAMAQALMGQQVAAMAPASAGGGATPIQGPAMASSPGYSGQGITDAARMFAAQQINSQKFGAGPASGNSWWATNGGTKAPVALPEYSGTYGGMAKG